MFKPAIIDLVDLFSQVSVILTRVYFKIEI